MNYARILAGGLLAGLIVNAIEYLVNGIWLMDDWSAAMKSLGKSTDALGAQFALSIVWAFLMGIGAVWLYAAIQPRFNPGVKTAVCAGLVAWFFGTFLATLAGIAMQIFPVRLMLIAVAVSCVEMALATPLGTLLYKDHPSPPAR